MIENSPIYNIVSIRVTPFNLFFIIFAQTLLEALNFAISSKTLLCEFQKNDNLPAKSSTFKPALIAASTYAIPSAIVNATSCDAVDPASLI